MIEIDNDKMDYLLRELAEAQKIIGDVNPDAEVIVRERSIVRTHATKIVVWLYAVVIFLTMVYIAVVGYITADFQHAIVAMLDLIKTALIPIVTFVIGHYYGSSNR